MEQGLKLAYISNDSYRAEEISAVTGNLQWQLVPGINQSDPVAWLRRVKVDLALVDLDTPDAIDLLKEIATVLPQMTTLAVVTPQHLMELQSALMAGASSFVAFPIEPQQFMATVLRSAQEGVKKSETGRHGRLVAVAGLKGGVGRTTLAVNMAVALRQRVKEEVVLVEAHHGLSDLSLAMNLLPTHTIASLGEETNIDSDVVEGHLHNHASRVRVLAAPPELDEVVELPVETWRNILSQLTELVPYVVVDTSSVIDGVLSEVLTMADDILVVTGPDLAGLRSAVALLQSMEDEPNVTAHIHVVLNRAGMRGGVGESAAAKQLGERISVAVPDDVAVATFALNRGVPFVLSHPRSIISQKLQELVTDVFDLEENTSAGFLSGLKRIRLLPQRNSRTVQEAISTS